MLALVTDASAKTKLLMRELSAPLPSSNEAIVKVTASSLNRGEVKRLAAAPDGTVPGWDLAGVVEQAAEDGSGPAVGTRVAGAVSAGSWAELAAVPTSQLAAVPDAVELHQAAVIPLAGLTALGVLRQCASIIGRRVAVTGAAGGVGRYAVQLAAQGGAHVTAIVGREERGVQLAELGADEVVVGFSAEGPGFDVVLESVGGEYLASALGRVETGGTVVAFGNSSGVRSSFNVASFYGRAPRAQMIGFSIFDDLLQRRQGASELTTLLDGVSEGTLDPGIALQASWRDLDSALERLLARDVAGKVSVLID